MILPPEPLTVQNCHYLLLGHQPFLDVEGDLEVEIRVFYVVVEEDQPAGVYLEVGVGSFELVECKVSELVLNKLDSFLNSVEILGKFLLFLAFLQKLETGIER
jgi:hypothetical protein